VERVSQPLRVAPLFVQVLLLPALGLWPSPAQVVQVVWRLALQELVAQAVWQLAPQELVVQAVWQLAPQELVVQGAWELAPQELVVQAVWQLAPQELVVQAASELQSPSQPPQVQALAQPLHLQLPGLRLLGCPAPSSSLPSRR
jgi:hypothetical protein